MNQIILLVALFSAFIAAPVHAADDSTPKSATKEAPFVNSLGMKFVPVQITGGPTNGKRVLFGIWDTRVQDYEEFAKAKGITPQKPDFDQGQTHPVVMVSCDDANSFCEWLSGRERASGKIGAQDTYRLPSDYEWSCAVGIGKLENAEDNPESKGRMVEKIYPWGTQWPPPKSAGNFAPKLHVDNFDYTSPVGSFAANECGLYDMGGNVLQWCEDWHTAKRERQVLRGASWKNDVDFNLQSSSRVILHPAFRWNDQGFRCVLEGSGH